MAMTIAIPRETCEDERRVAAAPESVAQLLKLAINQVAGAPKPTATIAAMTISIRSLLVS